MQLSRAPGFRLQEASRALNGLPAVSVARPHRHGNPFVVSPAQSAAQAVRRFRARAEEWLSDNPAVIDDLTGKNLACWCKPGAPCHADVLLELANPEGTD